MQKIRFIFLFLSIFFVGACTTYPSDNTINPQSRGLNKLRVNVKADPLIIPTSIKAYAIVDGDIYLMDGEGTGVWSYVWDGYCRTDLEYIFQVKALFWAIPFPIPLPAKTSHEPESGVNTLEIQSEPKNIINPSGTINITCNFGSPGCIENVTITNIDPMSDMIIQSVQIQANESFGRCGDSHGLATGQAFHISQDFTLPQTLICGDTMEIEITGWRAEGYTIHSGWLRVDWEREGTLHYQDICLEGNIFPSWP